MIFGGPRIDKDNTWRKFLRYKYKFKLRWFADMERIIRKKSPKEFNDLMNLKDFYAGDPRFKTEGKRIPARKDNPQAVKSIVTYTQTKIPKGTIHGLKFATVKDALQVLAKYVGRGKKHARKIQVNFQLLWNNVTSGR